MTRTWINRGGRALKKRTAERGVAVQPDERNQRLRNNLQASSILCRPVLVLQNRQRILLFRPRPLFPSSKERLSFACQMKIYGKQRLSASSFSPGKNQFEIYLRNLRFPRGGCKTLRRDLSPLSYLTPSKHIVKIYARRGNAIKHYDVGAFDCLSIRSH